MAENVNPSRTRLIDALIGARLRLQAIETQTDVQGRDEWLEAMAKAVEQAIAIMDLAAATGAERERLAKAQAAPKSA